MGWGCQHQVQFCKQRTGESCCWVLAIRGRLRSGPNPPPTVQGDRWEGAWALTSPWRTPEARAEIPFLGQLDRRSYLGPGAKMGLVPPLRTESGGAAAPHRAALAAGERGTKGGGQRRGHVPPDLRCSSSPCSFPLSRRGGSSWGPLASGGCRAVRGGASGGSGTPGTLCTLRSPSQGEAAPATRGAVNDSDRKRSVHRPQPHVPGAWDRAGCRPVAAAGSARPCRTPSGDREGAGRCARFNGLPLILT